MDSRQVGAGGWRVDGRRMEEARSSRRAGLFLTRRLHRLPKEVLRLLRVGAVLGRSFDIDLAVRLAGQPGPEALAALDVARRRHLVWTGGAGPGRCTFVHDKIREGLLETLSAAAKRDGLLDCLSLSR